MLNKSACILELRASAFSRAGARSDHNGPKGSFEPQVGQHGKDVIWVPTPQALVDKMLALGKSRSGYAGGPGLR